MGLITDYLFGQLPRPTFLGGKRIKALLRSISEVGDTLAQNVLQSRAESTAQTASRDGLLALARNMNDRGFDAESTADLLVYVLDIIEQHRKKGTEDGIKKQFARIGYPTCEIVTELTLRDAGAVNPFGGNIGFFFIIVKQPYPFPLSYSAWDGGGSWDDGVARWGWADNTDLLNNIRSILRGWKPSGTSCRFIVFDEDGTAGWNAGGLTGNYALIAINEPWEITPSGLVAYYYNSSFLVA